MSLNPDQQDYVDDLNKLKRSSLCPCGWNREEECVRHCFTGHRTDAAALVRRIKGIYQQIDRDTEARIALAPKGKHAPETDT